MDTQARHSPTPAPRGGASRGGAPLGDRHVPWARVVSNVVSPPVVLAALSIPVALHSASDAAAGLLYAAIFVIVGCLLPVFYIVWMVRRGKITDLHIMRREQRHLPFIVTLACMAAVLALFALLGAPGGTMLLVVFSLLAVGLVAGITLYWKISVHAATITGAVLTVGMLFGWLNALWFSPLIPLVGAARITLRRHTPMQVFAGALLGAALALVVWTLA